MVNFWHQLTLQNKPFLVLAPMDGVTDYVFREIIAGTAKPDVFFTEFTNVDALLSKGYEKTIPRLRYSQRQRPIVAQIWGTEPKNFFTVAKLVKDLGFDGIDINMGCPDRTVMKLGSGASLINNPSLAAEMIAATKDGAAGMPISVKTRIGVRDVVTDTWIRFLLEQTIDALTVHGRTAGELSKMPAHWEEIGKAVKLRDHIAPETVIIGNGDIMDQEQAQHVQYTHGVDGAMIGKGVFVNPWVFERMLKAHTAAESLELLLKHATLYSDTYPGERRFAAMRKYFKIYVRSFHGANTLLKHLMETKDFFQVEQLVKPYRDQYGYPREH
ncbi:tRNA-dihydrouridine synthase [Candidatus Gottesmanbacteria bacterium]|nr:tRNA-dihydrouridine synthase [Candidatus Gottesmanbacteria bacterium]